MSVGAGGPSGRGPSGSGGSIGPFWDRVVEVVPPSSMFAFLVSPASVAIVASSVRDTGMTPGAGSSSSAG